MQSAPSTSSTSAKKIERVDIRLYNTIVIFDVYTAARTPEAAREALLAAIADGSCKPTEITACEVTQERSIRASWTDQPPFIAADISDDEFSTMKGITTQEAWKRFYLKR